jgi:excisionase family DNA binding protein
MLLTPAQVRERLNLGRNTVYELLREGHLRSIRVGRLIRIPEAEIDRFIGEAQAIAARGGTE